MKIKKIIAGKEQKLEGKWEVFHSEYDKKSKQFHVLLVDDEKPTEKESAIGFQLSSDED